MWSSIVLFVHVTGAIGLFSVNSLVVLASLITFVVLAVLNNALNGRRMGAMRRAVHTVPDGPRSPQLHAQVRHPLLWLGVTL